MIAHGAYMYFMNTYIVCLHNFIHDLNKKIQKKHFFSCFCIFTLNDQYNADLKHLFSMISLDNYFINCQEQFEW